MSLKFLLDTNILSEPSRPIPNANVLAKLDIHQSEIAVAKYLDKNKQCHGRVAKPPQALAIASLRSQ
jgi:predicted nucleic acid-binding protein